MKRSATILGIVLLWGIFGASLNANTNDQITAPTLVPPTPIPQMETGIEEILPSESTVARIQANERVRVGILYNAPPFGELNIRGEVTGFDAELARSIAETWGVEVEFVQVTREVDDQVNLLRTGQIDMLLSTLVHRRELDALLEFSQTYFLGRQVLMIRSDDPMTNIENRRIGVVVATPAETAMNRWINRTGTTVSLVNYRTLDRAYVALVSGEIDGVVDSAYRLNQVSAQRPELTRILSEVIEFEPFGIGLLRQDASMRELVNRTLQYLTVSGRINEIHQAYFPGTNYTGISVWDNLGETAPTLAQYSAVVTYPAQYIVPRIQSSQVVRVAGLYGITADSEAPESERRLDTFHRALLDMMASRWGATVEYLPSSPDTALNLVASGEADIAVGIAPDWTWADRVDYTTPYLLHGDRLMVRINDEINGFIDLRGGSTILVPNNQEAAATRAVQIAEMPNVNARIEIVPVREQDLAYTMLAEETEIDADAVFGDSLKLIPHVQANPDLLRLVVQDDGSARWYSESNVPYQDFAPRPMVLAVPQNDIDFWLLVEYTLQELARDGTLSQLLQPVMMPEDLPVIEIWPGPSNYLGFALGSS